MGRIFTDGFESGEYDLYDDTHPNSAVISSAGLDMDGSYCLDLRGSYAYVQKTITADDEMYFSFLWRPDSIDSFQSIFAIYKDSTVLTRIYRFASDDHIRFYSGAVAVATGTKTFVHGTTYLVEIYFKMADSGGRFVMKFDGVTDIDYTGDTKPDANTQFDKVRLGYISSSSFATAYFDNFIIDDNTWIGETFIQAIVPNGIGNSSVWTPSAGDNYACVDEIPANDADYVESNAEDDLDTYIAGNVAAGTDIKCVQIQTRCEIAVGISKNLKLVTRVNGTNYLSGDKAVLSGAIKSLFNVWENNPDDAAAWERSDVNGMEIGIKSAVTTNTIRSYQTLAQIEWVEGTTTTSTSSTSTSTTTSSSSTSSTSSTITGVPVTTTEPPSAHLVTFVISS